MGIIEDAYQFGLENGLKSSRSTTIPTVIEDLRHANDAAMSLTPEFFNEYKEYHYTKDSAEIVFQVIYFGVLDKIADKLKYHIKTGFTKLRAQEFASGLFSEITGNKGRRERVVEVPGTPLERLVENFTVSTGHKPDSYALSQLEYIVNLGDRIARGHGMSKNNINWTSLNLYLQPGMTRISPEHFTEIREDFDELFTEPTMREELKDAKAIFNDHKYGLILAWYGGFTINAFYQGKEIGIRTLHDVPKDSKEAEQIMSIMTKEEGYPEYFASELEIYEDLVRKKNQSA